MTQHIVVPAGTEVYDSTEEVEAALAGRSTVANIEVYVVSEKCTVTLETVVHVEP